MDRDGGYRLWVFQGGPQLAVVLSPQGNPMLLGFVDSAQPAVNARTTAEVLLYFCLLTPSLPPRNRWRFSS